MRTLISILIIIIFLTSCNSSSNKTNQRHARFDMLPLPKDSTIFYFISKTNDKDTLTPNALDNFVNTWYSEMLYSLKEPVLKDYQGNKEIYRFTWIRTFHHPVSVRLEKQDETIKVFTKVCNGAGGYKPGKLIQDTIQIVQQEEYKKFLDLLSNSNFWNLPTEKKEMGTDGSEWIIEIVKDNKYHLVVRWTPREDEKAFREIGKYLISISKIKSEELEHYY